MSPPSHTCSRRRHTSARACATVVVAVVVLALFGTGCGGSATVANADGQPGQPRRGGTVWMEAAQEPPILNWYLAAGGMSITDVLTTPLKSTWVTIDDTGRWQPQLATSVPTVANGGVRPLDDGGMQITFAIDPRAVWSDGVPITCADLAFTHRTLLDPRWAIGTRIGWELVDRIECPSPRSVRVVMRERYAPYLAHLLNTAPLPRHVLRGADFSSAWSNAITVSSGPFVFHRWSRGDRLELRRNPRWWDGGVAGRPYLDRIVVRFVPDSSTMKLDLRMEDTDLIGLPPDTNLPDELASIPTAQHDVRPGAGWENLTFNTTRFPFADARVRRAAAFAIDRDALVDVVLRGQVPRLDSTLLPYQTPYHAPTFGRYRRDLEQVDARMADAGWTRSGSGTWRDAQGRRARITIATTTGNPIRLKTVQLVAAQLESAGFDPEIQLLRPEVFFSSVVAKGRFDLALYAFTQGVDPSQRKLFACSEVARAPGWSGKNNFRYCRGGVDALLRRADRELDPVRRAAATHELAERLATDLPVLPLYQQPDTLAWSRRLHGVRPNAMGRHLWNVDEWWIEP